MSEQIFATKGNLLSSKKSLELAQLGFDLMDKKRNILIREMMLLVDKASDIQSQIDETYAIAYKKLQRANVTLGVNPEIASTIPVENGIEIDYRSVMGVEIPTVRLAESKLKMGYSLSDSNPMLDETERCFNEVKKLTAQLAEVENSVYRLAVAIKKAQKRANALKNIVIPQLTDTIKFITEALEEKEREDLSRQKSIKRRL